MKKLALALLLPLGLGGASVINQGGFKNVGVTTSDQLIVGTSSVTGFTSVSSFLYLENTGTSLECVAFGTAAVVTGGTACTGAANGAGEVQLQPGAYRFFDTAIPADTVHVIGAAAGTLTVGVQ